MKAVSNEELIQLEEELMECGFQWMQSGTSAKSPKEKMDYKTVAESFFKEAEMIRKARIMPKSK
jgi:hypothetical protein